MAERPDSRPRRHAAIDEPRHLERALWLAGPEAFAPDAPPAPESFRCRPRPS